MTSLGYDASNNVNMMIDPLGNRSTAGVGRLGALVGVAQADGSRVTNVYRTASDGTIQLQATINPLGGPVLIHLRCQ